MTLTDNLYQTFNYSNAVHVCKRNSRKEENMTVLNNGHWWYPETTLDQITPMFPSFFNKKYVLEILKFAPLIVMIVML